MSETLIPNAALTLDVGRPTARVAVDMPLPHLDRLFDYLVPDKLAEQAALLCRLIVSVQPDAVRAMRAACQPLHH